METIARTALLSLVGFSLVGCRTEKDILNGYEANVSVGNYTAPIAEVTEKADAGGGSEQMWRLLAASANYMADDKENAVAQFDKAEKVFQRNDAKSVFAQGGEGALAMMTNDRAFDYDGGGLDRVFTCIYRSIDFMTSGRSDEARVELNRASQYQSNWLQDRSRDIADADAKLQQDIAEYERQKNFSSPGRSAAVDKALADASFGGQIREKTGFDPATSGNLATLAQKDYVNAYASHLTGVFRWLNADSDRNELKEAATFAVANPSVQRDAAERASGARPRNQVWIYVEDGLCPCREEWRLDLPIIFIPFANRYVQYAGMALPYLRYRLDGCHVWQVSDGAMSERLAPLQDVDRLVKVEYDVYMRGALRREITRTIVRVGAQVALGTVAEGMRHDNARRGDGALIALCLSQLGVAAWAASTTAADLRSWTALPKVVYAHRVTRPSNGTLSLVGDGAPQVQITIPEGNSIVFVRKPAPGAKPVVKVVTYPNTCIATR